MNVNNVLHLKISGVNENSCNQALNEALGLLAKKLPPAVKQLVSNTKVVIGDGLIESGGFTNAENKQITLDASKNVLSLQEAENFLIGAGYLNPGDWTKALPLSKNRKWSCLTYQFVHEFGHLIDGLCDGEAYKRLSAQASPTKYGITSASESFAEAFAYWIFELDILSEAKISVTKALFEKQPT